MNYNHFSGDFDGFIGDGPSASAYGQQFDPRLEYQLLELLPFLNEGQNVLHNSFYTGPDGGGAYDDQAYKFMSGGGMEQNATFVSTDLLDQRLQLTPSFVRMGKLGMNRLAPWTSFPISPCQASTQTQ